MLDTRVLSDGVKFVNGQRMTLSTNKPRVAEEGRAHGAGSIKVEVDTLISEVGCCMRAVDIEVPSLPSQRSLHAQDIPNESHCEVSAAMGGSDDKGRILSHANQSLRGLDRLQRREASVSKESRFSIAKDLAFCMIMLRAPLFLLSKLAPMPHGSSWHWPSPCSPSVVNYNDSMYPPGKPRQRPHLP